MEWKTIEVRKEVKQTAITQLTTIQVPVEPEQFSQLPNGNLVRVTEPKEVEQITGYNETPIKVVGVVFEGRRETYYEHTYSDLVEAIGEEEAAIYANAAGWAV